MAAVLDQVDRLYGLPLESFTRERNLLAAELRAHGDRDGAATVAKLRKPTVAAWTVNQLVRRSSREVDLLLDAGHRLIKEQTAGRESRSGETAGARQRAVIEELLVAARALLGGRATDQTLRQIAETLRAGSLTDEGRELLARGRVTQPLTTTGWEILAAEPPSTTRPRPTRSARRDDPGAALAKARRELGDATRDYQAALKEVREAEAEAAEARRALERAQAALRASRRRFDEAEGRLESARREHQRRRHVR